MSLFSKVLDVVYLAEKKLQERREARGEKSGLADVPTPPVPHDPFAPKVAKPVVEADPAAAAGNDAAPAKAAEEPIGDPNQPAQVFGRDTDPWTGRVKLLLRDRQVDFSYVDLDLDENLALGARLVRETKQVEGPYVYLRGELVGGYNAISEIERLGQLDDRILPADQRQKAVGGVRIVVPSRGPEGAPPSGGLPGSAAPPTDSPSRRRVRPGPIRCRRLDEDARPGRDVREIIVPPSTPNAAQWTVVVAEDDTRTLSQAKLVELHRKGDVTDATLVWRDGMAEWLPVSQVPELAALVKPPAEIEEDGATTMYRAASVPPPPPAPAPQPSAPAFQPPPPPAPRTSQPSFHEQPASPFAPPQGSQSPFAPPASSPFAEQQQPGLGMQQLSVPPGLGRNAPTMPMLPAPQLDANGRPIIREASIIGLPTQAFMAQVGGGRRKKRLFLVAGLVVAAAIGGGAFAAVTLSARDRAASELAFSKLSTCLIGTAPTGKETAASKFRNIQLQVMGTPVEKRAKGSDPPWPGRCAPIAHELSEAAKGLSGREALVEASEALAKTITGDPASTGSFKDPLDKVWAQATAAGLVAGAAPPGVPVPPNAASPMSDEALRDLPRLLGGNFTLSSVRGEAYVGTNARFLIDQRDLPGGPQFCTVTATETAVSCKKVSAAAAKVSPGLRLGGTADEGAEPLLFAGDHGQLGTFRGEDAFGDAYVVSAYARKEGPSFVLARTGTRDVKLIAKAPGKTAVERPLLSGTDIGNPTVTVGQLWEWLAYRSGPKATPPSHLMLRKLSDSGEPSAPTDVGELEDGTPGDEINVDPRQAAKQTETDDERQVVGCRTADATMVRIRGTKQDYVSFFQAGKWSPVAKSPSKGGQFSCHATEATSTRVQGLLEQERNFGTIHQTKCSLSGCTASALPIRDLVGGLLDAAPVDLKAAQAVEVDGKLLVVWNAGYNGGLRMRIGPMASIREASDVVIADQRDEKSALKLATVTDIRLIAAKQFAILFLATPAGTKLIRIDAAGKMTPITSTN